MKNRKDVLNLVRDRLLEIGLDKLKEDLRKDFYDFDHVIESLFIAFTSGKNIILHGPGGYGKTTIVKRFLKAAGLNSSCIVGYEDMEVEALLGVPNINKLTEHAIYEVAFERSVFRNPGILILEEFLDAKPSTAAALKDILTEGGYRRGNHTVDSLVSSVVICGNKHPDELAVNDTTAAFYKERFPIVVEVVWKEHTYERYLQYLKVVKKDLFYKHEEEYKVLAELCYRTSLDEENVSPRIAKDASDLIDIHGNIGVLKHVNGIDTSIIDEVRRSCAVREERKRVSTITDNIIAYLDTLILSNESSVKAVVDAIADVTYIANKLENDFHLYSENSEFITKVLDKCKTIKTNLVSKVDMSLHSVSKQKLDKLFEL